MPEPWLAPANLGGWIERYEKSGLLPAEPPHEIKAQAASSMVVCSTALRSVESARRIANGREVHAHPVYREAGLPYSGWGFPKLPTPIWAVVFRIAWFRGFSAHAESYDEAKARADMAARQLIELATAHGRILMMGHGIANILIARKLLAFGCRGPKRPDGHHWAFSLYQLP